MDDLDAAADAADAGTTETIPPASPPPVARSRPTAESRQGKYIGWFLTVALFIAVSVAISLAVQLDSSASPVQPEPPNCGGLYSQCCDEWDENWGPCVDDCDEDWRDADPNDQQDRGLFDAEEDFAERGARPRC